MPNPHHIPENYSKRLLAMDMQKKSKSLKYLNCQGKGCPLKHTCERYGTEPPYFPNVQYDRRGCDKYIPKENQSS